MILSRSDKAILYRRLFFGKQSVFGKKWQVVTDDGGMRSGYAPVCENYWKAGCHLKNKTGNGCSGCEIKRYTPVSDESVLRHIDGAEEHMFYVLHEDGKIRFGSIDFDAKPDREEKGYGWGDVSKFLDVLDEWKIPYTVARSTTAGFHVYFFMSEPYEPNKFRALIYEAFERCGFMEYLRLGIKTLPEVFPKQNYNSADGIGNGIKTPMIEPAFKKERNGLVTRDNQWIGLGLGENDMVEAQWNALKNAVLVATSRLNELIVQEEITVHDDSISGPGRAVRSGTGKVGSGRTIWQPAISGSIEKLLEGCAAFRKVREKCEGGEIIGHQEGMSLFHAAMHTVDGLEWFEKSVPGWNKTSADVKQLDHSIRKNYSPWTCKTMQETGVCIPGTKCFEPKIQVDIVDGQEVVRNDLPPLDPSPMRYAHSKGNDFLVKLIREVDALMLEDDAQIRFADLKEIVRRGQIFDSPQQTELKAHIRSKKVITGTELTKLFADAAKENTEAVESKMDKRSDMVFVDGSRYKKLEPYGYAVIKGTPAKLTEVPIAQYDIKIEQIRTIVDEGKKDLTVIIGKFVCYGIEKHFEISSDAWCDPREFVRCFTAIAPEYFHPTKSNVEHVRQAAMEFSRLAGIEKRAYLATQGWCDGAYLTPSVIIDKTGVRENSERPVDLSGKQHAHNLDFIILEKAEIIALINHILDDFLEAWPRLWTMVALGHVLAPAIVKPLGDNFEDKPTLFFEGLTGGGKTELTHCMQYFWGNFRKLLNLQSSAKGVMDVGYDFKDAGLVLDDFKGLDRDQTMAVIGAIQYGYGQGTSIKMTQGQAQNKSKGSRAFFTMTGELFISDDASVVSRTILIETGKNDTEETKARYQKCKKLRVKYRGLTPAFLHWFLNQNIDAVRKIFDEFSQEILQNSKGRQNRDRIAYNLGLNRLVFSLFVDFCIDVAELSAERAVQLKREHAAYISTLTTAMLKRCHDEQNGNVFWDIIIEHMDSGLWYIEGLSFPARGAIKIGFWKDATPNHAYLLPKAIRSLVKRERPELLGDERAYRRQLNEQGIIVDQNKNVRDLTGAGGRRWEIDLTKSGFDLEMIRSRVDPDSFGSHFDNSKPRRKGRAGLPDSTHLNSV
jgi:hypothetical protein